MHYCAQGSDLVTDVHVSVGWEPNTVITECYTLCSHSLLDLKAWNQFWKLRQHTTQMPQCCNILAICVCWDLNMKVFFVGRGIQEGFFISGAKRACETAAQRFGTVIPARRVSSSTVKRISRKRSLHFGGHTTNEPRATAKNSHTMDQFSYDLMWRVSNPWEWETRSLWWDYEFLICDDAVLFVVTDEQWFLVRGVGDSEVAYFGVSVRLIW